METHAVAPDTTPSISEVIVTVRALLRRLEDLRLDEENRALRSLELQHMFQQAKDKFDEVVREMTSKTALQGGPCKEVSPVIIPADADICSKDRNNPLA